MNQAEQETADAGADHKHRHRKQKPGAAAGNDRFIQRIGDLGGNQANQRGYAHHEQQRRPAGHWHTLKDVHKQIPYPQLFLGEGAVEGYGILLQPGGCLFV